MKDLSQVVKQAAGDRAFRGSPRARQQVHLRGASRRQQARDPSGDRAVLRREGDRRAHHELCGARSSAWAVSPASVPTGRKLSSPWPRTTASICSTRSRGFEIRLASRELDRMAIRKLKPVTPTQRFRTVADFAEITKSEPEKSLARAPDQVGWPQQQRGRITVRRRGGGHKRRYRRIDFKRHQDRRAGQGRQPSSTIPTAAPASALLHYIDGEKRYILWPKGLAGRRRGSVRSRCSLQHGQRAAAGAKHSPGYAGAQRRADHRQGRPDGRSCRKFRSGHGQGG
jgi:hypothetical protein